MQGKLRLKISGRVPTKCQGQRRWSRIAGVMLKGLNEMWLPLPGGRGIVLLAVVSGESDRKKKHLRGRENSGDRIRRKKATSRS